MLRFKEFISEQAESGQTKYKGSYNWHGESHTLYCYAASEAQAQKLLAGQLAKKLKVNTSRISGYYNKNQNGYKISKVTN